MAWGFNECYSFLSNHLFKERKMNLNAPKQITWWIAVICGVLGLLAQLGVFAFLLSAFWWAFIGFALLALATVMSGM
jgi:hypothetical protein